MTKKHYGSYITDKDIEVFLSDQNNADKIIEIINNNYGSIEQVERRRQEKNIKKIKNNLENF